MAVLTLTLRDVILLQQAVDEVFSGVSKVRGGPSLHAKVEERAGIARSRRFDPSKHPRGWHGYFINSGSVHDRTAIPGYRIARDSDYGPDGKLKIVGPNREQVNLGKKTRERQHTTDDVPYEKYRALMIANSPDNPVQWRAIGDPTDVYPHGAPKEGRSYEQKDAADAKKWNRVGSIIKTNLPQIDKELDHRLNHPDQYDTIGDKKAQREPEQILDTARVVMLMRHTGMRVGSKKDKQRGRITSFGAVSLRRNHVHIEDVGGKKIAVFHFPSKGRKIIGHGENETPLDIEDPKVVAMIEQALKDGADRGDDEIDRLFPNTDEYWTDDMLSEIGGSADGEKVKQHDLRTAFATTRAAALVKQMKSNINRNTTQSQADAMWDEIVQDVAGKLTNEPTEALQSYISPSVKKEWDHVTRNVKPDLGPPPGRAPAGQRSRRRAATPGRVGQRQGGARPGQGGRTAVNAPSTPRTAPATGRERRGAQNPVRQKRRVAYAPGEPKPPPASLMVKEQRIMTRLANVNRDIKEMVDLDRNAGGPPQFTRQIQAQNLVRLRLEQQLGDVRKLIGKSFPTPSDVTTNTPIGTVGLIPGMTNMSNTRRRGKKRKPQQFTDDDVNSYERAQMAKFDRQAVLREVLDEQELCKKSRFFSQESRMQHAKEGNALPGGSYPMPDADAVRRAAILIRAKRGNWQAATTLLHRRCKELGIPDPLAPKAAEAEAPSRSRRTRSHTRRPRSSGPTRRRGASPIGEKPKTGQPIGYHRKMDNGNYEVFDSQGKHRGIVGSTSAATRMARNNWGKWDAEHEK
jgi:hypothetical protein